MKIIWAFLKHFQLSKHNKELAEMLKPPPQLGDTSVTLDPALEYYSNHTAQIEVVRFDRTMEQIVFPIPEICEYLTTETRHRVYLTAERDDQGSKVLDFFDRFDDMFAEMKWQKKLRGRWLCIHWNLVITLEPRYNTGTSL